MARKRDREFKIARGVPKDGTAGDSVRSSSRSSSRPSVKGSRKVADPSGSIDLGATTKAEAVQNIPEDGAVAPATNPFPSESSAEHTTVSLEPIRPADLIAARTSDPSGSIATAENDTVGDEPLASEDEGGDVSESGDPAESVSDETADESDFLDPEEASDEDAIVATDSEDADAAAEEDKAVDQRAHRTSERQEERISNAERDRKRRKRNRIIKAILITLFLLVIGTIIAICVLFANHRWNTYDDAHDIQGTWLVADTETPITIDEGSIHLTDDVAYKYVIDPDSKTLKFTFGNMAGAARYRFSLDRDQLMIEDGEFQWDETLFDDAQWTLEALLYQLQTDSALSPDHDPTEEHDDRMGSIGSTGSTKLGTPTPSKGNGDTMLLARKP